MSIFRHARSMKEFFHAALAESPGDQGLRLSFAEWLADRGDPHAAGYRWLADHGKCPEKDIRLSSAASWDWWSMQPNWNRELADVNSESDRLPPALFELLDGYRYKSHWDKSSAYCEFMTLRDAEASIIEALWRIGWIR